MSDLTPDTDQGCLPCHWQPSLQGMTLLASGEPCAMCYLGALYAGISQVLFAVDRDEAAAHGFDYRGSYALYKSDPRDWPALTVEKLPVLEGLQPFDAFIRVGIRHDTDPGKGNIEQ